LREEETRQPVGVGLSFFKPKSEHFDTFKEISVPGSKRLERVIANLGPVIGYFTVLERNVHRIKCLRHNNETMNGFVKLNERLLHEIE